MSDQKVKAKSNRIAFFHSLGNSKGRTLDHLFCASHTCHNFPHNLVYIDELVEVFLKLSMKRVQVHLVIWTILECFLQRFIMEIKITSDVSW